VAGYIPARAVIPSSPAHFSPSFDSSRVHNRTEPPWAPFGFGRGAKVMRLDASAMHRRSLKTRQPRRYLVALPMGLWLSFCVAQIPSESLPQRNAAQLTPENA